MCIWEVFFFFESTDILMKMCVCIHHRHVLSIFYFVQYLKVANQIYTTHMYVQAKILNIIFWKPQYVSVFVWIFILSRKVLNYDQVNLHFIIDQQIYTYFKKIYYIRVINLQ